MHVRDISMPLFPGMPEFPGDPPFATEAVRRVQAGSPYNLSRLTLGSHAGTHLDPPSHFRDGLASVDQIDLDTLVGPCRVVRYGPQVRSISARELEQLPPGTTRLLLRTSNSEKWARHLEFFDEFVGLTVEGAALLADRGVRLVGIDALSIESDRTGRYPVHRVLLDRGVVILEGLLLGAVDAGTYELACLPLALRGGDGGPARAVLFSR